MSSSEVLVDCRSVSKRFCRMLKRSLWYAVRDIGSEFVPGTTKPGSGALRRGEFWAVRDVSFELKRGECVGIVGHNGAGKTTLLKMLNGLLKPDHGRIEMRGRVGALIALGAGFDPILTGRENIYANGCILGLSKREIDARCDEIIDFAEIADAIDSPVRNYSSGMQARLGFAIAAHIDPDILLIDEVLAVGDVSFRNKCLRFIEGIREKGGCYILVTHSFNQVLTSCPKALLMHHGELVAFGDSAIVVEKALELQFEHKGDSTRGAPPKDLDKNLRILDVEVKPASGDRVVTGCPVEVEVTVEAKKRFANVSWAFYIWNKENLLRLVSKQSSDSAEPFTIGPGIVRLSAATGPLALAPKQYSIRATVSAGQDESDLFGYDDDPVWFSVFPKEQSVDGVRGFAVDDLVSLESRWNQPESVEARV